MHDLRRVFQLSLLEFLQFFQYLRLCLVDLDGRFLELLPVEFDLFAAEISTLGEHPKSNGTVSAALEWIERSRT